MFREKYIGKNLVYYSDLIPDLEHYFTTRGGTVDEDTDAHCNYLNLTKPNFIHPSQTHSSNIGFAREGVTGYPDTDAIILTNHTQGLYLKFADCTPIIFYDKRANIGAIAHAGWRGTVQSISTKTAIKIIEHTGSTYNDIYIVIGPAISECCYKVGDEVLQGVKKSTNNYKKYIHPKSDGTYIDLKGINSQQLIELGIPKENIDICPFCTSCRNDLFYSYRKENGTPNRHNAVIKLKHN